MQNLVGQTIADRYRVDEFLGRGGMAEVYKVWDQRRATYLAMKLLTEDLALDKVFIRRFKREGQNLARLQHPNIVRFYGLEQDGRLAFMLLDYVEGETLKHKIFDTEGSMPAPKIQKVSRAVCSALQFAHSEGLVHCDIKPANIMIDQHGTVLLSDFGIARMTDAATATMVGAGTPAYMAPEQAKGLNLMPQTDMYAYGIVLFEMLTGGERPFTGEQAQTTSTSSERVRWEQVHLDPPPPSQYNPKLSAEIDEVVLRCLSKAPEERYNTPLNLLNALEKALDMQETTSQQSLVGQGRMASEAPTILGPEDDPGVMEAAERQTSPPSPWLKKGGLWVGAVGIAALFLLLLFTRYPISTQPSTASPKDTRSSVNQEHSAPSEESSPSEEEIEKTEVSITPTTSPEKTPTAAVSQGEENVGDMGFKFRRPSSQEISKMPSVWDDAGFRDLSRPGAETYMVDIDPREEYLWGFDWCGKTPEIREAILSPLKVTFSIDGDEIPLDRFFVTEDQKYGGWYCHSWSIAIGNWAENKKFELDIFYTLSDSIYDGEDSFPAGEYHQTIFVNASP